MDMLQVSHEELLLLLGLARLPMPLALGDQPIAGYTQVTLGAALTGATSSLIARGVLIPSPRADEPPTMADGLAALLADSALADSALMVVARHGADSRAAVYTRRGSAPLVHTQPAERVHRLERLPEMSIVVDHVLSQIVPHTPADQAIQFTISAAALPLAIDAVLAGQPDTTRRVLGADGVSAPTIDAFIARLGNDATRYALMVLHGLDQPLPQATHVLIVQGRAETWYVEDADSGQVQLATITPELLRVKLHRLIAPLVMSNTPV